MNRIALIATLVLTMSAAAPAAAPSHCTKETLGVRSTPVTISYCVVSRSGDTVSVAENYSSPKGSYSQTASLNFLAGDEPSRVIEDLAMDRLGMQGTLHLTLVMRGGSIHIESALLTPGAITVK